MGLPFRVRTPHILVGVILSLLSMAGCDSCGGASSTTSPTSPTPVATISLDVAPKSATAEVPNTVTFKVTPSATNFSGQLNLSWNIDNGAVAVFAAKDDAAGTVTAKCLSAGGTNISVSTSQAGGVIANARLECTAQSTTTTTAPPTSGITVTLSESSIKLGVGEAKDITATISAGLIIGAVNWTTGNLSIASVSGNGPSTILDGAKTGSVKCLANGTTTLRVEAVASPTFSGSATATIICGTGTADPTPPSRGSPKDLVGSWVKRGTRTSGSNCEPPVFGSSFQAGLVIELSADGNQGIRFIEAHTGTNSAGPFLINLFYSQFDVERKSNGLLLDSGFPVRDVFGKSFTTHISVFFADDGTILGTETFESEGPPPCKDTYIISGERAK